jgi:aspartate carbamoyltransferase catalytic subunit
MVFQQHGLYAAQYNIFFLTKAQEAKVEVQKPSKVIQKISWEDKQDENPTKAKEVIITHPPPKNNRDTTKYKHKLLLSM